MGSQEGMDLAKMAVTVLLVVLLIGAVVALVYKGYSWFTSGADRLGDQVGSIDSSAYSQFDDAQVIGTDVLTALKTYRDSDIAIVICNKNCGGYTPTPTTIVATKGFNYCGLIAGNTAKENTKTAITYDDTIGRYQVEGMNWDSTSGSVVRNTNFSPTTDKNNANAYVRQSANWYGNLIYDKTTNEVCGILFREMQQSGGDKKPLEGGGT